MPVWSKHPQSNRSPRLLACDCCQGTSPTLTDLSAGISEEAHRIRRVGFTLLYETCQPIPIAELADKAGYTPSQVEEILGGPELAGRSKRDRTGNLAGIAGLSVEPTPHAIQLDGKTLWTWCALDAVGILAALEATATIHSKTPADASLLDIRFVGGVSQTDTVLFILDGFDPRSSLETWCPSVNFFTNAQTAAQWVKENWMSGDIVPVKQITSDAAQIWKPVVSDLHHARS